MQPWLSNILIKQIELTTVVYITGSSHCIDAAPSVCVCITRLQDACAAWICCIHACILAYILILTQYIYLCVRILTHTCTYAYLNVLTCCYRYPRTCVDFYLYLSCKSARNLLRISQGTGISCCCYKVGTIPNSTGKNLAKSWDHSSSGDSKASARLALCHQLWNPGMAYLAAQPVLWKYQKGWSY